MKKNILSLIIAGVASIGFASAQISVDWSVDEIIKPTQLNSSQSGTAVPMEIALKNNGTDTVLAGDSIFFSMGVAINTTLYIFYPSSNLTTVAFGYKVLKRMNPGDTMHFIGQVNSQLNIYPSANVNFIFTSIVLNRARGLGYEQTATGANNTKTAAMVWFNQQGWGVGTKDATKEPEITLYPNTNSGIFEIQIPVVSTVEPTHVSIYSLTGVKVKSFDVAAGESSYRADCTDLSAGTYIVRSSNGHFESSSKVVIQ